MDCPECGSVLNQIVGRKSGQIQTQCPVGYGEYKTQYDRRKARNKRWTADQCAAVLNTDPNARYIALDFMHSRFMNSDTGFPGYSELNNLVTDLIEEAS